MDASPPSSAPTCSGRPTRQAARKASATIASYQQDLPEQVKDEEDYLKEALAPMKDSDREDHKAWVEMESDPAYFSGVLKDLGVEDVKIQELFAVSMEEVEQLPQPVYGFVFLCRYEGEDQEDTEEAPQELWFANQTMPNGCATVALINIVMNQPTITLGPTLASFQAETAPATPLVRGYRLDSHPLIRHTHNAFARRMEHLNADLTLQNEYEDEAGDPDAAAAKRNKKRNSKRPNAASKKRAAKKNEQVCHYKAFLFALGQVWVLDGLEGNPVSLGPATADTWPALALLGIQAKMADAGELVNVLAVCQAPARALRDQLAANVAALKTAVLLLPPTPAHTRQPETLYGDDEAALRPFRISVADVVRLQEEQAADAQGGEKMVVDDAAAAAAAVSALEARQTELVMAYNVEEMGAEGEAARCEERKEDFGAAIHAWVEKLAAKGALRTLVEG